MSKDEKQYGLIMPKKAQLSAPKAGNVFGDDDDSDKEEGIDWMKKALKPETNQNRIKKQTKLNIQKALDEDPTIYQYDEIYDEMEKSKEEDKVAVKKEVKKPKYILDLLKAAERRKKEQELRIERMVQKERDAEGEMFADKESFVTSAYRAKLEEFKKMEEEEEEMNRLEAIGDVTKQPDISGFYRQLYSQTVDKKNIKEEKDLDKKPEDSQSENIDKDEEINSSEESSSEQSSDSASEPEEVERKNSKKIKDKKTSLKFKKTRQYRKRNVESSDSESEHENKNSKDDSDDDDDDDDNDNDNDNDKNERNIVHNTLKKRMNEDKSESPKKKTKLSMEKNGDTDSKSERKSPPKDSEVFKIPENKTVTKTKTNELEDSGEKVAEEKEEKKKVSIWEKRTVGAAFEAALQRYYARKAMRLSGS